MPCEVSFAIIGTPALARTHANAIKNVTQHAKHYIFSRDFARAKSLAEEFGFSPVRNYEEILMNEAIQAVDILTEPHRHAELALKALSYNKHVLLEKPLDSNLEQAQKVLVAARNSSSVVSVISQNRFDPVFNEMKRKIEQNEIGKPFIAELKLFWKRTDEYYQHGTGWRGQYGNILLNQAIHFIDMALYFFGEPQNIESLTSKVNSKVSCYDTAILSIRFKKDVLFNMVCSTACHESEPLDFVVYGTGGKLSYLAEKQRETNTDNNNKFNFFKKKKVIASPCLFELQIRDFVEAIKNQRPPAVTVEEAYKVLEIIDACGRMEA